MSDLDIVNPVPEGEARGWVASLATTFMGDPYGDEFPKRVERWRREWFPERTWGVQDGGRWIATLATEPRTVTVPGADGTTVDVEADALTGVTVAATHRRRGLLKRMIGQSLERAKQAGEPFSVLIAAEWPIYGRYGYAPAAWTARYVYSPRLRGAAITPVGEGRVRHVEPDALGTVAPAVFDRARRRRAGQVDRRGLWWAKRLGLDGFGVLGPSPHWLVHEGRDGVDGILAWRATRDFDLDGAMGAIEIQELVAASDEAYRNLWAYLSGMDVVGEVTLYGGAVDEPVRWLLGDGRALRQEYRGDHLWIRLLDVPASLSKRGYASAGRLVLDIVDDAGGGYATGRYLLDVSPDGASCTATTESADLVLSQQALASAYLGGTSLRERRIAGGADEQTPGSLGRFDAMFATALAPWNATMF
jgi:predicted acetyltransferase